MILSFKESVLVSLSDFWTRKLRSSITILSIVLGTLTIVVVQAMVSGVKESTLEWIMERGGMTRIDIRRNWEYPNPRNLNQYLTLEEFELLQKNIPEVRSVSAQMMSYGRMSFKENSFWGSISGTLPGFLETENWQVDRGRFINDFDLRYKTDTLVIGSTIARELFGNVNPLGQFITFQEKMYKVIGVMEEKYFTQEMVVRYGNILEYLNRRAFMPISSMISRMGVDDRIENITIHTNSIEDTEYVRDEIDFILLSLRSNEPVFRIDTAMDQAQRSHDAVRVFQVVFLIISLISLLVAGIVIMNIMMATIKERTREIGIRMAVGAGRADIFFQFLIQTVVFTVVGGLLGAVAGLSLLDVISEYIGVTMRGSISLVFLAVGVAVSVGIIFGTIPAVKAANLDPVKCLAYE